MCRLSAIIPREDFPDGFSALMGMMINNAAKNNKDGYGVSVINNKEVKTFKRGKSLTDTIGEVDLLKFAWENYSGSQFLVGHVRAASAGKGKICDETSHPFEMGNLVLAHNGHLGNFEEVNKKYNLTCTVDSETFLTLLVKELDGKPFNIEAFNKVASILEGSYAFIIFDKLQPNKLFLAVGVNNLTIYKSDKAWIVNTEKGIDGEIDGDRWCRSFTTKNYSPVEVVETKSGTLYSLDQGGLTELGKIKLNPYIPINNYYGEDYSHRSWVNTYNKVSSNIDWNKIVEQVSFRTKLLKDFNIGNTGLCELLESLPLIPNDVSKLDTFWCSLLSSLLVYLEDCGYLVSIDTKRMLWLQYTDKAPNFYDQINFLDIELPYFMNSVERLQRLSEELTYAVDKKEVAIG